MGLWHASYALFRMGWMSWFTTKLIISMDIIVWELTHLYGLQYSRYVCEIVWVLYHMSLGKLSIDSNCSCLLWYFQRLFKCQMLLYQLNYLVIWYCYEWFLTFGRIVIQLCCVFAITLWIRSYEILWNSNLFFYELGFVAHNFRQAQHIHYIHLSFRACLVH